VEQTPNSGLSGTEPTPLLANPSVVFGEVTADRNRLSDPARDNYNDVPTLLGTKDGRSARGHLAADPD
jgi:hypothetical protein